MDRRLAAILIIAVGVVAACSVEPGRSARPSALAAASPTPTLNPNQLEELRRSAGVSLAPPPTMTPAETEVASAPTTGPTPVPSPYDAALEAMLPSSLRNVPLTRYSVPITWFATDGDMCSFVCPEEPVRLSAASGVDPAAIVFGVAYADRSSDLKAAIMALRFPKIPTAQLVDIRVKERGPIGTTADLPTDTRPLTVGSRAVTWATYPPFYDEEGGEYLLATGDVLFIVVGAPPTAAGAVPDDVKLAIGSLP